MNIYIIGIVTAYQIIGFSMMAASCKQKDATTKTYKLILLGDSGVGKTSIFYNFKNQCCSGVTHATISVDSWSRTFDINNDKVTVSYNSLLTSLSVFHCLFIVARICTM